MDLRYELEEYLPFNEQEERDRAAILAQLEAAEVAGA